MQYSPGAKTNKALKAGQESQINHTLCAGSERAHCTRAAAARVKSSLISRHRAALFGVGPFQGAAARIELILHLHRSSFCWAGTEVRATQLAHLFELTKARRRVTISCDTQPAARGHRIQLVRAALWAWPDCGWIFLTRTNVFDSNSRTR